MSFPFPLLLASSLALIARAAHGAAPPQTDSAPNPAGVFSQVDSIIAEAMRSVKTLQDCEKLAEILKVDLAKKQKELKAEFNARIPPAFNAFLMIKRERIDKQQTSCLQICAHPGRLFSQAHDLLRQIEPKSMPGIAARSDKIAAARARYNQMFSPQKETKK